MGHERAGMPSVQSPCQVFLGWLASAVTLLADAAHSGADAIPGRSLRRSWQMLRYRIRQEVIYRRMQEKRAEGKSLYEPIRTASQCTSYTNM